MIFKIFIENLVLLQERLQNLLLWWKYVFSAHFIWSIELEKCRFLDKVSDSVSVSDSVIFWDSVSVSVETQNHGFGRALQKRYDLLIIDIFPGSESKFSFVFECIALHVVMLEMSTVATYLYYQVIQLLPLFKIIQVLKIMQTTQ